MVWNLIGIAAALLITSGFVYQIMKMYRTKSSKDVNLVTLFMFSISASLWALYGINLGDIIFIIANIMILTTLVLAITMHYHYNRNCTRS